MSALWFRSYKKETQVRVARGSTINFRNFGHNGRGRPNKGTVVYTNPGAGGAAAIDPTKFINQQEYQEFLRRTGDAYNNTGGVQSIIKYGRFGHTTYKVVIHTLDVLVG